MTDRQTHDAPTRRTTDTPAAGFTLIEILVVLFILGVLAAIVVSIAGYVMSSASRQETSATQRALLEAVQAYYDAGTPTKAYPPDRFGSAQDPNSGRVLIRYLTGHSDSGDPNSAPAGGTPAVEAATKVLLTLPPDAWDGNWNSAVKDGWGVDMHYEATGGLGGRPVIISAGPDTEFGEDGDTQEEDNIRSDESQ